MNLSLNINWKQVWQRVTFVVRSTWTTMEQGIRKSESILSTRLLLLMVGCLLVCYCCFSPLTHSHRVKFLLERDAWITYTKQAASIQDPFRNIWNPCEFICWPNTFEEYITYISLFLYTIALAVHWVQDIERFFDLVCIQNIYARYDSTLLIASTLISIAQVS